MDEDAKLCIALIGLTGYITGFTLLYDESEKRRTQTLQEFPREVRRFTSLPYEIDEIKTPVQARRWLDENLTREKDPVLYNADDFYAPCGLAYQKGKGDCEDYAICAAALLQGDVQQSYLAVLGNWEGNEYIAERGSWYAVNPSTDLHAVYVYQVDGKWGLIGVKHSEFEEPIFATPEEVLGFRYNSYRYNLNFHEYILFDHSGLDLVNGNQNLEEKITKKVVRKGWVK